MKLLQNMPFDLERWHGLVRACATPKVALEFSNDFDAKRLDDAWNELAEGESLAVHFRSDGGLLSNVLRNHLRQSPLASWVKARGIEDRVQHSLVFPSTGGGFVLLDAQSPQAFRTGTKMLPAGRRRWKFLRNALGLVARFGLHERLGLAELWILTKDTQPTLDESWQIALSSGVPGLFQTTVIQLSNDEGDVDSYLKLATGTEAEAAIRWEGEVLSRLAWQGLRFAEIPKLQRTGDESEQTFIVQSALSGSRSPDELRSAHLQFLRELQTKTHSKQDIQHCDDFIRTCQHLREVQEKTDPEWTELMVEARERLLGSLAGKHIPCSLAHGDFTPWNTLLDEESLCVFDWEFARFEAVALHDVFHYVIQTEILVVHATDVLSDAQTIRQILAKIREVVEGPASGLQQPLEGTGCEWLELLLMYLFDITVRDEWLNAKERPPFEQVEWLRKARMGLMREVMRRLGNRTDNEPIQEAA